MFVGSSNDRFLSGRDSKETPTGPLSSQLLVPVRDLAKAFVQAGDERVCLKPPFFLGGSR